MPNMYADILSQQESSEQSLIEFLRGSIYRDFVRIGEMRSAAIKDELAQAATMEQVTRLQGELLGIEFWKRFPEGMLQAILEEREDAATKPV